MPSIPNGKGYVVNTPILALVPYDTETNLIYQLNDADMRDQLDVGLPCRLEYLTISRSLLQSTTLTSVVQIIGQ
jgi:hypothetical protein